MTDDAGDDFYSLNATDDWRVAEEDVYYDDAYGIQDDVQDDDLNLVAETMTWLDHLLVNANANVTNATQLSPAEDVNPDALLATLGESGADLALPRGLGPFSCRACAGRPSDQ